MKSPPRDLVNAEPPKSLVEPLFASRPTEATLIRGVTP
jgi:hypothetical protein